MLFSSETWGYELKPDTNAIENLFNKFCKNILGHKPSCTRRAWNIPITNRCKNEYGFILFIPKTIKQSLNH